MSSGAKRWRRGAAIATAVALALGLAVIVSSRIMAAQAPQSFTPFSLTNGFGTDARTERVVSWVAPTSADYTAPYIKVSADASAVTGANPTPCASAVLPAPMTAYTAYACTLTGLAPGTAYFYTVGASATSGAVESPGYGFTTEAASASSFTFLDFADTQSPDSSQYNAYWGNDLRTALQRTPNAAFVVQNGDLTDPLPTPDTTSVVNWMTAIGTSLSGVGFNLVMGNHDDGVSGMWATVFPRASLIDPAVYGAADPLQYAYVYGNALFVNVNTNATTIAQLNATSDWVKATVAEYGQNPDGSRRFVIVVEHKSPFGGIHSGAGTYPTGDLGNPDIVQVLPKTYDEAGVDLVLAGHDHNLIRSLPITWDYATNKAQWNRSQIGLNIIDSTTDGLVYYVPSFAGQKNYGAVATSASVSPWIDLTKNYSVTPANDAYSTVTVDATSIHVGTYTVGSATPVDSFVITHSTSAAPGVNATGRPLGSTASP